MSFNLLRKLLAARASLLVTRSYYIVVPGITTRSKKLLVTQGTATSNKKLTPILESHGSFWPSYAQQLSSQRAGLR